MQTVKIKVDWQDKRQGQEGKPSFFAVKFVVPSGKTVQTVAAEFLAAFEQDPIMNILGYEILEFGKQEEFVNV